MEIIQPIDERIKEFCARAVTAKDSGVSAIFEELNDLIQEHSAAVRYLAAQTLSRVGNSLKAAD